MPESRAGRGAPVEFRLPDVGEGLDEAEVVAWLVVTGETVRRDQPLVELQTDKAVVELPSPVAGRIVSLAFSPGDLVKVGEVLVVLDPEVAEGPRAAGAPLTGSSPVTPPLGRPKAPPSVRQLAVDLGVDLTTVAGSGPAGRILAADVERTAARAAAGQDTHTGPTPPTPVVPDLGGTNGPGVRRPPDSGAMGTCAGPGQMAAGSHPLRGVRRVTAEAMARSWAEIPHLSSMDEVDATALLEARRELTAGGVPVSLTALFVAACAAALKRFPLVNASLHGAPARGGAPDQITVHESCHVGVAVATESGLLVPVVRDADRRALPALETEIRRLLAAARTGRAEVADLRGGTFTVTNYGSLGGRFATPIIRPPEAAIMGFGAIRARPFVLPDGTLAARPTLPYCLSVDHRLIDGDLATAFGEHVAGLLSAPVRLLAGHLAS